MLLPSLGVAEGLDLVAFITFVQVILMVTLVWEPLSWSTDSQTWLLNGIIRELKIITDGWELSAILIQLVWGVAWVLQFLYLLFLCWNFVFPFVSSIFIVACWSIFVKANLKSLSGNSNISVILVLASCDGLFSFMLRFFWFLELLLLFGH